MLIAEDGTCHRAFTNLEALTPEQKLTIARKLRELQAELMRTHRLHLTVAGSAPETVVPLRP